MTWNSVWIRGRKIPIHGKKVGSLNSFIKKKTPTLWRIQCATDHPMTFREILLLIFHCHNIGLHMLEYVGIFSFIWGHFVKTNSQIFVSPKISNCIWAFWWLVPNKTSLMTYNNVWSIEKKSWMVKKEKKEPTLQRIQWAKQYTNCVWSRISWYVCAHLAIEFLYGRVLLDWHGIQASPKLDKVNLCPTYNDLRVREGWDMCGICVHIDMPHSSLVTLSQ